MSHPITKTQLVAAAEVLVAVADSIRQLSPVPSGQLYAIGCASFISLPEYEHIVEMLKGAGLVREERHLLIWTGPQPLQRRGSVSNPWTVDHPCQCECMKNQACMECICPLEERSLRAVMNGSTVMTKEQREWCLNEIDQIEGYDRKDYEASADVDLARGVLAAWTDYCRDKGLI